VELPAETRRALIRKAEARLGLMSLETKEEEPAIPGEIAGASRTLLGRLKPDVPMHLDELLETFDTLTSSETIAALFELELLGLVKQLPGKNFVKVW
jgi:DNA processing protein